MPKPAVRCDVIVAGRNLPPHLSPSQYSKYVSCGLRYYFESILGWREPASAASAQGTIVHDTAEAIYRLPAADRGLNRATELLVSSARALLSRPEYEHLARDRGLHEGCTTAITRLYALEQPDTLDVRDEDIECEIAADVSGVSVRGRLDRRTRNPLRCITDYKTGRRPPAPVLAGKLTQLYVYAAAADAAGDPADEVELLFLGGDGPRVRRPIYPQVLNRTADALHRMREDSARDLAEASFTATPSALCGYCPFKRVCPAQRSNAPTPGSDASDTALRTSGLLPRHDGRLTTADPSSAAAIESVREPESPEPW